MIPFYSFTTHEPSEQKKNGKLPLGFKTKVPESMGLHFSALTALKAENVLKSLSSRQAL